jgi:hypothetical protein
MDKKFLDNLTDEQKKLGFRIFDLILDRVLERAYSGFDKKVQEEMQKVFSSGDNKAKEDFIKKNIPNMKDIFEEEAKKAENDIKIQLEKQS